MRSLCHDFRTLFLASLLTAIPLAAQPLIPGMEAPAEVAPETEEIALTPELVATHQVELDPILEALGKRRETMGSASAPAAESTTSTPGSGMTTAEAAAAAEQAATEAAELEDLFAEQEDLIERVRVVYEQQLSELERAAGDQIEVERAQAALAKLQNEGPDEKPPYSYLLVDRLIDDISSARRRADSAEGALQLAREALESAKEIAEDADKDWRRLKEETEHAEGAAVFRAREFLQRASLEARLATARHRLRRLELAARERAVEESSLDLTRLRETRDFVADKASFKQEDLDAKLAQLDKEREALGKLREKARSNLSEVNRALSAARKKLEGQGDDDSAKEEERARQLQTRLHRQRVSQMNRWEEWLQATGTAWERRFALAATETTAEERAGWEEEADAGIEQLERERRLADAQLADIRKELLEVRRAIETKEAAGEKASWWTSQRGKHLERLLGVVLDHLEHIEESVADQRKLADDLNAEKSALMQRDWAGEAALMARQAWDFELTEIDDKPVTIGKLITAVLLLIFGWWLSGRVSRSTRRIVQERFGMEEGASAGVESLVFYSLLVAVSLFALHLANVPLTLFAFVGGALAIGLGFGSQNLINNFICGLMLLMERPIRVGDLVEVEGTEGHVLRVGARCTTVRTRTNIEILIPNSSFLESAVVNWTLSDKKVRLTVVIGVAYGSPLKTVKELLLRAATEHDLVLKDPSPAVVFQDFGGSSLDFDLNFWIRLHRTTNRFAIMSDVRFKIDELFREAGIEIPFPQRDINFDPGSPLQVRVIRRAEDESESSGG